MGCDEVYIGIGANLGEREKTLQSAVDVLEDDSEVSVLQTSPVYETAPIGVVDQPYFLNAVLLIKTSYSARDLLDFLLSVEKKFGRVRKRKWGPRTLDLDILLYGDAIIDLPGLHVPHMHLPERAFVLDPLCDIAPQLIHPVLGESIKMLAAFLKKDDQIQKVEGLHLHINQ